MQQMYGVSIMTSTIDDNSKIRSSTGVALDWFTPIGPLSLSYSIPLTKNNSEIKQRTSDLI